MTETDENSEIAEMVPADLEDLKTKKPTNRAPQGIRTFTVCRQHDETGASGDGVVIEGITFQPHVIIFSSVKRLNSVL